MPDLKPPIEIKGLRESMARVRTAVANARVATSGTEEAARSLIATADAVTKQLQQHESDLRFEVSTLGNSSAASAGSSETEDQPAKGTFSVNGAANEAANG